MAQDRYRGLRGSVDPTSSHAGVASRHDPHQTDQPLFPAVSKPRRAFCLDVSEREVNITRSFENNAVDERQIECRDTPQNRYIVSILS